MVFSADYLWYSTGFTGFWGFFSFTLSGRKGENQSACGRGGLCPSPEKSVWGGRRIHVMRYQGKIQEFLFTRQTGFSAWEIMPPDLILRFTDGIRIRDRHPFL
jgi:hypothetical protein